MIETLEAPVTTAADLLGWALAQFEGPLLGYAHSLLRDVELARDVVQDTFLKLHQEEPAKIKDALKPWLFAVCRNRALDVLRKNRRMIAIQTEALHDVACEQPTPTEHAQRRESHGQVLRLLDRLAPNQREVIRLRFQSDLSYQEIAEITELSVSNVGFLLHTGLRQLRTMMTA